MARVSPMQGDFSSGEFSPMLYGRSENPRYKSGLGLCQNFIPTLQGPVTRRAGTVFVAPTKNTTYTKLIPFKYSVLQDYMLEFGNNYIRFFTQRSQIVQYSFVILPGSAVVGATYSDPNGNTFTVANTVSASTVIIMNANVANQAAPPAFGNLTKLSGTGDITLTYTSVTFPPYEVTTPYTTADLKELKYAQSLDVLYLVHPDYPPATLSRFGNEDWVYSAATFIDGPYLDVGQFPFNIVKISAPSFTTGINYTEGVAGTSISIDSVVGGATISNATANADGLIRITFASGTPPDIYGDRSQVFISGVTGTTEANGTWIVNKVNSNTYDLIGSAFVNAYVSGGKMYPAPFRSGDVGRLIRIGAFNSVDATTQWGYVQITAVTDGAHATVLILASVGLSPYTGGAKTTQFFAFGVYGAVDGYPSCVTFHEDRLFFGAPGISKVRLDGSNVSDYLNFGFSQLVPLDKNDGVVTASNAVSFSLNSHDQNAITWLRSDELGMPVGTQGGPWIVKPSILSEALSPTNISAKKISNVGSSASSDAITAAKATIFLETSTRRIRELTYFYQIGGFRAIDLTEIAEHLPGEGITTELVYQAYPQPLIWFARADGTLISVTYDRQLDGLRTGWARHYLGGQSDAAGTPTLINSLGVIPSPNATTDDLWVVTTRYINGTQVQNVEYLSKIFQDFDEQQDAFFVDCGATIDNPLTINSISNANPANVNSTAHGLVTGDEVRFYDVIGLTTLDINGQLEDTINNRLFVVTKVDANNFTINNYNSSTYTAYTSGSGRFYKLLNTISGITWLEGQTVSILGDGFVIPPQVVTGGSISFPLNTRAGVIHLGLPITARIQQLVLEGGAADGTSIGKNRRINETAVMLHRSNAFKYGDNFSVNGLTEWDFRQPSDRMDAATPLFSGIQDRLQVESDYDLYNQLTIEITDPTPLTILAIMPQQVTYDRA